MKAGKPYTNSRWMTLSFSRNMPKRHWISNGNPTIELLDCQQPGLLSFEHAVSGRTRKCNVGDLQKKHPHEDWQLKASNVGRAAKFVNHPSNLPEVEYTVDKPDNCGHDKPSKRRHNLRNQSVSSLMQMMQTNHAIDIALQETEPILNMIDMNNPTIHHNQDSNKTVSNTPRHSDQNTIQNQNVSHTADDSQNKCTAHTHVKTLNPPLTFITLQPACSAFSPEIKLPPYFKQHSKGFEIAIKTANLNIPTFNNPTLEFGNHLI